MRVDSLFSSVVECEVDPRAADPVRPELSEYSERFEHVALSRDTNGVLEVRLHTEGGPLVWGDSAHTELVYAFTDIGGDPENRVVVLTGTGDRFITELDDSWIGEMNPAKWDKLSSHGKRLLTRLLEIPVPVIAAVNGPVSIHPELPMVSDIVLAAEHAWFCDAPHFKYGTVPGDGAHLVWPLVLGPNRGRYFLLTAQRVSAREALDLGVVNEVLPADQLMPRAHELADLLARQPDVVLRYTRDALTQQLKRMLVEDLAHGLALAGLGAYEHWPTEARRRTPRA
jgi:enoyl-CoA hydratase/carnithine racemase